MSFKAPHCELCGVGVVSFLSGGLEICDKCETGTGKSEWSKLRRSETLLLPYRISEEEFID